MTPTQRKIPQLWGTATYGFDPGLRHGAIVYAKFALGSTEHHLEELTVDYKWTKRDAHLSKDSDGPTIAQFVHDALLPKFSRPATMVGVEWDPQSVYWHTYKVQIVTTGFMIGYLMRGLQTSGLPLVFVTPKQLRAAFGISSKDKEKNYVDQPIQMVDHPPLDLHGIEIPPDSKADVFDAFLVSYFAAVFSIRSM